MYKEPAPNVIKELETWYDIDIYRLVVHSQTIHLPVRPIMVEVVPKGYTKATGIQKVCEKLGIAREDTYAFGDSANDIEMLRYAGHGICMGDGTEDAKAAADYVTTALTDDGILHGLEHFKLI
jgi:HAD superfamily hydrolase (TIGR01484 family)